MNNAVATPENRTMREPQRQERRGWLQPQVNIIEEQDGFLLEAEMPGVNKDGLEILVEGNDLTIIGRRAEQFDAAQLVYRESYDRDYRRSFELDPAIDAGRISARMDNGVLFLRLPKAEKLKPRKIAVE
jgi:HSP20 family molecular chaperone IbpA